MFAEPTEVLGHKRGILTNCSIPPCLLPLVDIIMQNYLWWQGFSQSKSSTQILFRLLGGRSKCLPVTPWLFSNRNNVHAKGHILGHLILNRYTIIPTIIEEIARPKKNLLITNLFLKGAGQCSVKVNFPPEFFLVNTDSWTLTPYWATGFLWLSNTWPARLYFHMTYCLCFYSKEFDITPLYVWETSPTPSSARWYFTLEKPSHGETIVSYFSSVGEASQLWLPTGRNGSGACRVFW